MKDTFKPVAIVTGASRGIGRSIALKLLKEGYLVVGLYKSSNNDAALLCSLGVDMRKVDVGSDVDVSIAIAAILDKYHRLDLLINNAGINIQGEIESYSFVDWDDMINTDLSSVFLMSKYCIPALKTVTNPCIINISSRIGIDDFAESEFVVYGAMKAAVNNFTVGLARELRDSSVRVNAIIPTPTKTDLFDQVFDVDDENELKSKGKLGMPSEVADIVINIINNKTINGRLVFDERVKL